MTEAGVRIDTNEVEDGRFSRFRLIQWWDQSKVARARVLVVGAGALGNEIIKNLALLGFTKLVIVDMDRIERSNLSRAVLFRPNDVGRSKASVAAEAARALYPDLCAQPLELDILRTAGLGLFEWADVILAGLDNREARLWINRSAWLLGKPWIDGAIEGLNGVARVFLPGQPPCYECTLGEVDWAILNHRLSCNLLSREDMDSGKVPTTPTVSAVIAGIQVQEALKLLHGMPVLAGKGYVFEGLLHTSYVTRYTENPDCMSHHSLHRVIRLRERSCDLTLDSLLRIGRHELGSEAVIDFSREVIWKLQCVRCNTEEELFAPIGSVSRERALCPHDGTLRSIIPVHGYSGSEPIGEHRLDQLGLPAFDIFTVRSVEDEVGLLIGGDESDVLGPLCLGDRS